MSIQVDGIGADGLTVNLRVTETPLALALCVISLETAIASQSKNDSIASLGTEEVRRVASALRTALREIVNFDF